MSFAYRTALDERYENDADFRAFVDHFRVLFREAKLTPADARTAVNFAAYLEEIYRDRPAYIYVERTGELIREDRR